MKAKVSVIVITLDRLGFLREAVASVRAQLGVEHELIVVDDGSTDGTPEWLRTLDGVVATEADRDSSRSRAANMAIARNRGFELAAGDYAWFLDDDDRLRPGALATLASALDRNPEAVAAVGARTRFGEGVAGGRIAHPLRPLVRDVRREFLLGWTFVPSQALLRAEAVRAAGGWNEEVPYADDLDLWARLLGHGPVALEPDVVVEYRVHGPSRRSPHIVAEHEALLRPYAAGLAPRGDALRSAGLRWERANEAFDRSEPRTALRSTLRAITAAPTLVTSPLLRPLSTRLLVRSALRSTGPTRRWVEARAARPAPEGRRGAGYLG